MAMPSADLVLQRAGVTSAETVRRVSLEGLGLGQAGALSEFACLEDLSLAGNKIATLEGLGPLRKLRRLDVSGNRLRTLAGIEHLSALEELYVQGNMLDSWDRDVRPFLLNLARLRVIHFKSRNSANANPVCSTKAYPTMILRTFPQIEVIDGCRVHLKHARSDEAAEPLHIEHDALEMPEPKAWALEATSPFKETVLDDSLEETFTGSLGGCKALLAEADQRIELHTSQGKAAKPPGRPTAARRQLRQARS